MTSKKDLKKLGLYSPPQNTLFGKVEKDSIRVAYVHPTRGIIDNVSVKEANKYAKKNPGTTFMFWNREKLRYLTINEVNNLTVDDIKRELDRIEHKIKPLEIVFVNTSAGGHYGKNIIYYTCYSSCLNCETKMFARPHREATPDTRCVGGVNEF